MRVVPLVVCDTSMCYNEGMDRSQYWKDRYQREKAESNKLSHDWYIKHKEERRYRLRDTRYQLKLEVLSHYSNGTKRCVRCGESRPACLSIDHINGGGTKHRAEVVKASGNGFYRWLRKNNFPQGYQTLCMNCQFVKKFEALEAHYT